MGRSSVWAIAAVYCPASSAGTAVLWVLIPGAAAWIRQFIRAARAAEPSTDPTCRVVLYTPDPAPAAVRGRRRIAVTDNGDHRNAFPTPNKPRVSRSNHIGVVPESAIASHSKDPAAVNNPNGASRRGATRSTRIPATGASAPERIAWGIMSIAACVGVNPRTFWAYNMSGKATVVMEIPTLAIARFPREKLRSRNKLRGTSGSDMVWRCQITNTVRNTSPAMMSKGTEVGPRMVPQSYVRPSWIPKIRQNIPSADRITPTTSNRWGFEGRRG